MDDVGLALTLLALMCSFVALLAGSVGFWVISIEIRRAREDALRAEVRQLRQEVRRLRGRDERDVRDADAQVRR
jgi:hypothetical protein